MQVHLFQLDLAWEDKQENYRRVEAMADSAQLRERDLVVLPELFDTGFSFNLERTADDSGETLAFLQRFASVRTVTVQGSLTVRTPEGRGLNRAVIVGSDGAVVTAYDKIHPFSFGREPEFFDGGSRVTSYEWAGGGGGTGESLVVSPLICYDLRFPEVFRACLKSGIDSGSGSGSGSGGMDVGGDVGGAMAFAIGANWPSARSDHWATLLRARAIENQAYVFGVNRTGSDPFLEYSGGSSVIGPRGEVLGEAGEDPCVVSVDVSREAVVSWRELFPAIGDRRPDIV